MKKLILITFLVLFLSGCSSLIDKIPENEFKHFSYNRSGNVTSAHIEASGAMIKDGFLIIDSISIKENNPFVNFYIYLEGYKRELITHEVE